MLQFDRTAKNFMFYRNLVYNMQIARKTVN